MNDGTLEPERKNRTRAGSGATSQWISNSLNLTYLFSGGAAAMFGVVVGLRQCERADARTYQILEAPGGLVPCFDDAATPIHLFVRSGAETAPLSLLDFRCALRTAREGEVNVAPLGAATPCGFDLTPAPSRVAGRATHSAPLPMTMTIHDPSMDTDRTVSFKLRVFDVHRPAIKFGPYARPDGSRPLAVTVAGREAGLFGMQCTWTGPVRDPTSCDTEFAPSTFGNPGAYEEGTAPHIAVHVTLTQRSDQEVRLEWASFPFSVPATNAPSTISNRPDDATATLEPVPSPRGAPSPSTLAPDSVAARSILLRAGRAEGVPKVGLSVGDALSELNGLSDTAVRKRTIETSILPRLSTPIAASDAVELINGFDEYDRADLLREMRNCIRRPIIQADRNALLEGISGAERDWAGGLLDAAGRCDGPSTTG